MGTITLGGVNYYIIPGGRPTLDKYPNEVPLIMYNKDLNEILQFGDTWRARGRFPCVILPSPTLWGGNKAWDEHKDPSGLLDNIPAHIDGYIVDVANAQKPELPIMWVANKTPPTYFFWERKNQEVLFRGSHSEFVQMFSFDPEKAGTTPTTPVPSPDPTDPTITLPTNIRLEVHIYHHHDVD